MGKMRAYGVGIDADVTESALSINMANADLTSIREHPA
jgi:hypothetical protein